MLTIVLCTLPTISLRKLEITKLVDDDWISFSDIESVLLDIVKSPTDADLHITSFYNDLSELTSLCYWTVDESIIRHEFSQLVKDVMWRYDQYRLRDYTLHNLNLDFPDTIVFQYLLNTRKKQNHEM